MIRRDDHFMDCGECMIITLKNRICYIQPYSDTSTVGVISKTVRVI